MNFPKGLPLPGHVPKMRNKRLKELLKAGLRAVVLRGLLIGVEGYGFLLFGSQALLMDALASSIDLLFSFLLIFCLYVAKTPPDREHPFGHGRIEPIAGMFLGIFLIQVGFFFTWRQCLQLAFPEGIIDLRAALCALTAAVLMELCYRYIEYQAKEHRSSAMLAEAIHCRTDAVTSLLAFACLLLSFFFPKQGLLFDRMGGILIACSMIYFGYRATRENLNQIIDKRPSESLFQAIREAATSIQGVYETEKIGIQEYGPDAHVNIDIELDPQTSVEEAHRISQKVRRAIQSSWPAVLDVTVHVEPYFEGDHLK